MDPVKLLREYAVTIAAIDEPDTWHALGMLVKMHEMLDAGEHGRFNRWLGWVQGWLYCHGLRTIDQMRDETRGIDAVVRLASAPTAPATRLDPFTIAKCIYEVQADARNWRDEAGYSMPQWRDLGPNGRAPWMAAADAVLAKVTA